MNRHRESWSHPKTRPWVLFCVVALLCVGAAAGVALIGIWSGGHSLVIMPNRWEDAEVKTRVDEIVSAYAKNEVQADSLYKGKVVAVVGRVFKVERDPWKGAVLILTGDNVFGQSLYCVFDPTREGDLVNLTDGERVVIMGVGDGKNVDTKLAHCRVAKRNLVE